MNLLILKEKDKIIKQLKIVIGIIEKKQILPIIENILIKSIGKKLFFLSTNLKIQIITYIFLKKENNKICILVSGKKLFNIIKSFSKKKKIFFNILNKKLNIKSGNSKFSLQIINPKKFPIIKNSKKYNFKFQITEKILKKLFNMVYFAMAFQDIRPYLNAILIKIKNNNIYAVATDGFRLAIYKKKIINNYKNQSIIIPRKTIFELKYLLKDTEKKIKIKIFENKIEFCFSKIKLISKLIKGKYPNYKNLIPKNNNLLIINRENLLKALQRIYLITNENFQGVQLKIKKNILKLIFINSLQEKAEEKMKIKYLGKKINLAFNINFFLDILNNLKNKEINIYLNKKLNSSILISIPNKNNFKYIVMPMYL